MENLLKDKNIRKIEEFFKVPERVVDKIKNVAKRVKGGYILFETWPRWDGSPGPWTKLPVAKIIFHRPTKSWKLYWMRASGKWELYGEYKTFNKALKVIDEDKQGCFWG